jgi:hypothetical protein
MTTRFSKDDLAEEESARLGIVELPLEVGQRVRVGHCIAWSLILLIPAIILLASLPPAGLIVVLAVFVVGAMVFGIAASTSGSKSVQRLTAREPQSDAVTIVRQALLEPHFLPPHQVIPQVIGACARAGKVGQVLRLDRDEQRGAIKPLMVPFEALELDQTDARFRELRASSGLPDDGLIKPVHRDMIIKGSWFFIVFFGIFWLLQAFVAWQQGRITLGLAVFTALLLSSLFLPSGSQWGAGQLFAVPGGLVLRKATAWGRKWSVHLFRPQQSLICVFPLTKQRWCVAVSDGRVTTSRVGTKPEVELALQAWLSPLEPPRVDELTDLA